MKAIILSQYRQQLQERLKELGTAVANIKAALTDAAETQTNGLQDFLDHSREQSELQTHYELMQMHFTEREQILIALHRMDNGTFGECNECGDTIAAKRLLVKPSAFRCMECQHSKEGYKGSGIVAVRKTNLSKSLPSFIFSVEAA